jgi:hypothetical protein
MWGNLDLNQGPTGYESAALTTELLPLCGFICNKSLTQTKPNWQSETVDSQRSVVNFLMDSKEFVLKGIIIAKWKILLNKNRSAGL